MKWEEERAARRPSLAGGEGDGGGVTGAEALRHAAAGRTLVEGGVVLAGGEGEEIDQTEGVEGAQPEGRPGFVGWSGRKLVPNDLVPCLDRQSPSCVTLDARCLAWYNLIK